MINFTAIKNWFGGEDQEVEIVDPNKPEIFDLGDFEQEAEAISVESVTNFGFYGYVFNMEEVFKNINELVKKYREMAVSSEIEYAVNEIVNESIVKEYGDVITLDLDETDLSDNIKRDMIKEFEHIIQVMDFNNTGDDLFRSWFIDGRGYYQPVVDKDDPKAGIQKVNHLDSLNCKRVKDKEGKHFYIYEVDNENHKYARWFEYQEKYKGFIIGEDHVIFIPSGLKDDSNSFYISHLHKAIRAYNQLKLLEDAAVIYTISRAPERRAFYVSTGKVSKNKQEEYLRGLINKFRNRVVYDSTTGNIVQSKNVMTVQEDYWLPANDDGKGTKVETLQGGTQLTDMVTNIEMFKRNLLKALKVPYSRFDPTGDARIAWGDGAKEISREELRFSKYVNNLRSKFEVIFLELLKRQLILKEILDEDEFEKLRTDIHFDWAKDQYYEEVARQERLLSKIEVLDSATKYVGEQGFFSKIYLYKEVLGMTDEEILEERHRIKQEKKLGIDKVVDVAGGGMGGELGGVELGGGDLGGVELGGEEGTAPEEAPEAGGEEAESPTAPLTPEEQAEGSRI